MMRLATEQDLNAEIFKEIRDKYLPIVDTIGEDLLGDYKALELSYIVRQIKKGRFKTILDFGAGTSCLPAYLDSLGYEVWALDDGSWHPEVNEKSYNDVFKSKVKYITDDILKNPNCVPDNYFDVIYSASVFEHTSNAQPYLEILNKKLKAGGLIIHIVDMLISENTYQPEKGTGRLIITNDIN